MLSLGLIFSRHWTLNQPRSSSLMPQELNSSSDIVCSTQSGCQLLSSNPRHLADLASSTVSSCAFHPYYNYSVTLNTIELVLSCHIHVKQTMFYHKAPDTLRLKALQATQDHYNDFMNLLARQIKTMFDSISISRKYGESDIEDFKN